MEKTIYVNGKNSICKREKTIYVNRKNYICKRKKLYM
jgi:hypothetical protein